MQKNFENNFNKWRDYDLLNALYAYIALVLTIVNYEYAWGEANK